MARRTRFITWAKKDPTDETPIQYTFHMKDWNGFEHTEHFTSEEPVSTVPHLTMTRLQQAWVKSVELVDNKWNVVLYE
jgi:hypothetical protein